MRNGGYSLWRNSQNEVDFRTTFYCVCRYQRGTQGRSKGTGIIISHRDERSFNLGSKLAPIFQQTSMSWWFLGKNFQPVHFPFLWTLKQERVLQCPRSFTSGRRGRLLPSPSLSQGSKLKFTEINLVLWGYLTGFKAAGFVFVPNIYTQIFVSLPRKSLKNMVMTHSHFSYVTY